MKNTIIKKIISLIIVTTFLFSYGVYPAYALPEGAVVQEGTADFSTPDPNTMNITTSDKAVINYNSFSIAGGETVNFIQPSASSICLNRVTGGVGSEIFGSLNANGQIWLINPDGILIGEGAQIDVSGFIASTANISDSGFMSGNYNFNQLSTEGIANQGDISASNYAALMAHNISNTGNIIVPTGKVYLACGESYVVDISGKDLISISVDGLISTNPDELDDQVTNTGFIQANSGQIFVKVNSVRDLFLNAVNNEGIIQATTVVEGQDGTIEFTANDRLYNSGTIEADHINSSTQGLTTVGTISAPDSTFNQNDADTEISGNYGVALTTDNGNITFTGATTLTADCEFRADNDNSGGGNITQNAGAAIECDSNDLTLRSGSSATTGTGNVTISQAVSHGGNIDISAAGGTTTISANVASTANGCDLDIAGRTIDIDAALKTQGGAGSDIALASGSGGIDIDGAITSNGNLTINSGTGTFDSSGITLTSQNGGQITIDGSGSLFTIGYLDCASHITVGQTTTPEAITISSSGVLALGSANFYANGNITVNGDIDSGANVGVYADYDEGGSGSLTLNADLDAGTGVDDRIQIQAADSFTLDSTYLNRFLNEENLIVTSTAGDITVSSAVTEAEEISLKAAGNLTVNQNITSSNNDTITLYADNNNNAVGTFIFDGTSAIATTGTLDLRGAGFRVASGDFDIRSITTAGNLSTIGNNYYNFSYRNNLNFTIRTDAGNITNSGGATLLTSGALDLWASGVVGTQANPVGINCSTCQVYAGGSQNNISIDINGTASARNTLDFSRNLSGRVIFNGEQLYPTTADFQESVLYEQVEPDPTQQEVRSIVSENSNLRYWIDLDYLNRKKREVIFTMVKVFEGVVEVFRKIGNVVDTANSRYVRSGQQAVIEQDLPITIEFLPGYMEIVPAVK